MALPSCSSRTSHAATGQATRCRAIAPPASTAHVARGDRRANISMNRRQLSVRSWAMSQGNDPACSLMRPARLSPVTARNTSSSVALPPLPSADFSSGSVPSAISRPWSTMPILSASRSATSRMCVVRMMVAPARTRAISRSFTWRAMAASSPVSGSSSMMRRGIVDQRARERHLLLHAAREALAAHVGVSGKLENLEQLGGVALGPLALDAPQPGDELEVLQRRELVVDHRLVGEPGRDPLGGDGIGQRIDAEDGDAAGSRGAAGPRSCAAWSSCRRRSDPAARKARPRTPSDRDCRRPRSRTTCAGRGRAARRRAHAPRRCEASLQAPHHSTRQPLAPRAQSSGAARVPASGFLRR